MMDVLQNSIYFIANSLFIIGLWTSCKEGMLLGFMQELKLNDGLKKPLFGCPPCMASIWGGIGFLFTGLDFYYIVPYVVALCGLNAIVINTIDFD